MKIDREKIKVDDRTAKIISTWPSWMRAFVEARFGADKNRPEHLQENK